MMDAVWGTYLDSFQKDDFFTAEGMGCCGFLSVCFG
jgi:hypothetical protein